MPEQDVAVAVPTTAENAYTTFFGQSLGKSVMRYQMLAKEEREKLAQMDIKPWSVVNLMPFPLNVNGVLHSRLIGEDGNQVPACPIGERFVRKAILRSEFSIKDAGSDQGPEGVANYVPVPWVPKQLALEYTKEFLDKMQMGGIIIYEGDHDPQSPAEIRALEQAEKSMIGFLRKLVLEGETKWSAGNGELKREVNDNHRKAAQILFKKGYLKKEPIWLVVDFDPAQAPNPCPGCGSVPDKVAAICKGCGYVFSPLEAYKAALVEYGHISFDRMNAKEWKAANELKAQRDEARAAGATASGRNSKKNDAAE